MPKTAAQARPADLKRTVRRLLSYMGHAKFSLLAVGVLASVAAIPAAAVIAVEIVRKKRRKTADHTREGE